MLRILLVIPLAYLVVMPGLFFKKHGTQVCKDVVITIADSGKYHFVTTRDIRNTILRSNSDLIGKPYRDVSIDEIERSLSKYRELRISEVYMDIDGILHVFVDQRVPVMRVMPAGGGDFFVDNEGVVMRRRNLYTPRLHLVGGNVKITQEMLGGISVLDTSVNNSVLKDIFHLVRYINGNNFWSAQIDQIYVDRHEEIDLIPRVGNHVIHLGKVSGYEEKFKNLQVFYEKVLPEVGWNKYSVINLAFRDQVVCTRR